MIHALKTLVYVLSEYPVSLHTVFFVLSVFRFVPQSVCKHHQLAQVYSIRYSGI